MSTGNNDEREFGWDDPIEKDGSDYTVAPDGDYDFEIVDNVRGRHSPKPDGKLPACNKATLKVRVVMADGELIDIKHQLFLHSRCEGMLCEFFTAIGQRRYGEKLKPNWHAVLGSRGRCRVGSKNWTYKGRKVSGNEIKEFYEAKTGPVQQQPQQPATPPEQPTTPPVAVDDEIPF